MERSSLHINGTVYDAKRVVEEWISHPPVWKQKGWEFIIQLLDPSDTRIRFHTSGTTGPPKTIHFSKKQVIYSAENTSAFFRLSSVDHLLLCLPAEFVAGRLMMARVLVSGASLTWLEPALNPLADIDSHDISFAAFTPAQVATILNNDDTREKFSKIRQVIIGGGEISTQLETELATFPHAIYATYGMTETLTHVAVRKIGESVYQGVYKDVIFSTNESDCLVIDLPFISNTPILTKDVVEIITPGSFRWKGRLDHVINTGGIKLYAEELEKKIVQAGILDVQRFYISSKADPVFGQSPVIVLLKGGHEKDTAALLTRINGVLNKHESIKHVVFFDKFDFTETGKLKRLKF